MPRFVSSSITAAFAFVVLTTLAGAAGSAAPEAKPAASPPAAAPPAAAPAAAPAPGKIPGFDAPWKDLKKEQKAKYMKEVVVPKMKTVFQGFDAKEYKVFNCATCHGKKAKAREFKMPSPEIPALPGTHEGFKALLEKKPKLEPVAKFMGEQVKPQMAALLAQPEFDPKKPAAGGFGCPACHTIENAK
jgi:hypothetical protein